MVEVFGIDGVAAEFEGGGEDRGIPIGKPVALLDPQGGPEDGFGDGLDRVGIERFEDGDGFLMGQLELGSGVHIKLRLHLHGEADAIAREQLPSPGPLGLLGLRAGSGVEQDVRIEEKLSAHSLRCG